MKSVWGVSFSEESTPHRLLAASAVVLTQPGRACVVPGEPRTRSLTRRGPDPRSAAYNLGAWCLRLTSCSSGDRNVRAASGKGLRFRICLALVSSSDTG